MKTRTAQSLLLALLTISMVMLSGKVWADEDYKSIESDLGRFYLESANQKIKVLKSEPHKVFYTANVWVYKYIGTHDPVYLDSLMNNWSDLLSTLNELDDSDSMKLVLQADLAFKRSMLEFMEGNYFSAVRYAHSARSSIKKHAREYPNSNEGKKIQGVFNVAFGSVPRKYQWLIRTFGYEGDINLGMKQIHEAAEKSKFLRTEANLVAYYVEKNLVSRPQEAIDRLARFQRTMPSSILVDYFLSTGYGSLKQNEKALAILAKGSEYKKDPKVFFISYWDYSFGKSYYFKENYSLAGKYFERFLGNHKGKIYQVDATFRLGMAHTLQGAYHVGQAYFEKLDGLASGVDEDEYARHMSQKFKDQEPNGVLKTIFRARNLYDGGYYEKAKGLLAQLNPNTLTLEERTELYYRYARIYHTMGELSLALTNYEACISEPEGQQLWLQVYSHYFMAEMARERRQYAEARSLYQKALSYDDYFYQSGMENRCKVALAEIKKY